MICGDEMNFKTKKAKTPVTEEGIMAQVSLFFALLANAAVGHAPCKAFRDVLTLLGTLLDKS